MDQSSGVRTRHEQGRFARAKAEANGVESRQRARAAVTVASHASDVHDCAELLSMLGLHPARTPGDVSASA
ncbi:hypothetical protein ACFS2C_10180 [Prauserella oleivorans]|uniref:Uncharacterized protein n=1 Tax=Prauserella oleivorans TaxID=1478153 RepID=A0ABW5W8J9_9PSEU